jgi:hypothetical protein
MPERFGVQGTNRRRRASRRGDAGAPRHVGLPSLEDASSAAVLLGASRGRPVPVILVLSGLAGDASRRLRRGPPRPRQQESLIVGKETERGRWDPHRPHRKLAWLPARTRTGAPGGCRCTWKHHPARLSWPRKGHGRPGPQPGTRGPMTTELLPALTDAGAGEDVSPRPPLPDAMAAEPGREPGGRQLGPYRAPRVHRGCGTCYRRCRARDSRIS